MDIVEWLRNPHRMFNERDMSEAATEIERLRSDIIDMLGTRHELEEARKDAERYRWLRDQANKKDYGGSYFNFPEVFAWDIKPGAQMNEPFESVDAAIDAAMHGADT